MDFFRGIKYYVRNPLGIIALFITLIYGVASLLLGSTADKLSDIERWPIIIFIVAFPFVVLFTFYRLVTKHHRKLYSPGDFRADSSFLSTSSPDEIEEKVDNEVTESVATETDLVRESTKTIRGKNAPSFSELRNEYVVIEDKVIRTIESELKTSAKKNIKIGVSMASFDALFYTNDFVTALEVKIMRNPRIFPPSIDAILYNAMLANNSFENAFRLILVVVYLFDRGELSSTEKLWKNRIQRCPVNIDLRFISKGELSDNTI